MHGEPNAFLGRGLLELRVLSNDLGVLVGSMVEHLTEEVVAILEVPVESSPGDSQCLCERINLDVSGRKASEGIQSGIQPL